MENDSNLLLQVKNLKTYFSSRESTGTVYAVDDVSFYVNKGETLGIVGESGSGKSISCMSLVKLVETPPGRYEGGEIWFEGQDLMRLPEEKLRDIRGNRISYVFQEPMTSLNPVFRIGRQLSETMILHRGLSKREAMEESVRLLEKVRIPNPERIVNEYPFALSGGMRQRVMIAMALACEPSLLVADEPTTALDVTIQAQVLDLMNDLKKDTGASIIFITHDLGVIAEMSDRVMVMYAGKVVETAPVRDIFKNYKHPYTYGLINSKPDISTDVPRLHVIPGNVPDLDNRPSGCPFHPRCEKAMPVCGEAFPPNCAVGEGHTVACWLYAGDAQKGGEQA